MFGSVGLHVYLFCSKKKKKRKKEKKVGKNRKAKESWNESAGSKWCDWRMKILKSFDAGSSVMLVLIIGHGHVHAIGIHDRKHAAVIPDPVLLHIGHSLLPTPYSMHLLKS